jgi:hypothetical protein
LPYIAAVCSLPFNEITITLLSQYEVFPFSRIRTRPPDSWMLFAILTAA